MRVLLILLGNFARLLIAPLWLLRRNIVRSKARWVEARLAETLEELPQRPPLWRRLTESRKEPRLRSIDRLWHLAREIAADPRIDGLVVHVPHLRSGWASCTSAREPLAFLRAQGKRVVVFLPLGGGQRELYIATAADRIVTPPQATIALLGVAVETLYLKPLLDRLGVEAEVFSCGEYKTAAEPLIRSSMSEPQREQLTALTATLQGELERALTSRPGIDAARARACFDHAFYRATAAVEAGLIDACAYEDQLLDQLGVDGAAAAAAVVASDRYLAAAAPLMQPLRARPAIGIVAVHGAIAQGPSQLPQSRAATLHQVVGALRAARRDTGVRAVILHVDSPGGSALASDLIHREIVRLREKKPVVACFANVAASGGYYVAAACQRIVAQPTTTTGSIGVISAKLLASDLVDRLGVRPDGVRSAPHADMLSPFHPLTETQRSMMRREVDGFYATFLAVVAEGRNRSTEDVDRVARGRVWSGIDAAERGLVDVLGGLERAVAETVLLVPELRTVPRRDLVLRFVKGAAHGEPAHVPSKADDAAQQLHELGSLLATGEGALYYALVPNLGT